MCESKTNITLCVLKSKQITHMHLFYIYQLSVKYESLPNFGVELKDFLRCFPIYLRSWQDFYATAGRSGRAKYQLCLREHFSSHSPVFVRIKVRVRVNKSIFGQFSSIHQYTNHKLSFNCDHCLNILPGDEQEFMKIHMELCTAPCNGDPNCGCTLRSVSWNETFCLVWSDLFDMWKSVALLKSLQ